MKAEPQIRPFQPRDEALVIDLWKSIFPDDPPWNEPADVIARKLAIQSDLFLVAIVEGKLVGTVLAGFDGVRGWIHKLAVDPEFQHQGIALQLMRFAESSLASVGCPKVNLQVRASNSAVVDFYRNAGYSIEDRISMGKRLV